MLSYSSLSYLCLLKHVGYNDAKFRLNIGLKMCERIQIRGDSRNTTNNFTLLSLAFMESVTSPGLANCNPDNIPEAKNISYVLALGLSSQIRPTSLMYEPVFSRPL